MKPAAGKGLGGRLDDLRAVLLPNRFAILILACLLGVLGGVGAYAFIYAEGLSYIGSDPKVCVNCHIMRPQYDSWQKSSHHKVAGCIDCHLPHDLIGKYMAKAENGYHHSKAFTLQDFPEPITIKPGNARILEANCINCHRDLVDSLLATGGTHGGQFGCVHCHLQVGHGERAGLGGPFREGIETGKVKENGK